MLNLSHLGPPLVVIYGMSGVGSLFGGWLSSAMLKSGSSVNAARKTGMLVSALIVVPVVFAAHVSSLWLAVVLMGLATAGHQGFSSNLYTLVSDMFPKRACGSIAGLGGCFGYVGATLFMSLTGLIVSRWTQRSELHDPFRHGRLRLSGCVSGHSNPFASTRAREHPGRATSHVTGSAMRLKHVIEELERIAPTRHAEAWDNVEAIGRRSRAGNLAAGFWRSTTHSSLPRSGGNWIANWSSHITRPSSRRSSD